MKINKIDLSLALFCSIGVGLNIATGSWFAALMCALYPICLMLGIFDK